MAGEEHQVFPNRPDLADVLDRTASGEAFDRVLFREGKMAQAAEINEAFSTAEAKLGRVGRLTARSGDRIEGADIAVDREAGTVTLTDGMIFVRNDVRSISEAVLVGVPMTGDVAIGVRVVSTVITHEDNPDLLGLMEGTAAFGEAGAIREIQTLAWGFEGDGGEGDLFEVYFLRDGFVVDQAPPPALTGVNQAIAVYDYDAHKNYIAEGCEVTALGIDGDGKQVFAIAEGTANILGFKRTRRSATRFAELEQPDIRNVASEPHTFVDQGDGSAVITVNRPPINGVSSAIVTKQVTETVVRGAVAGTTDLLSNAGVTEILSVVQGGTTYTSPANFLRSGDRVDWSPAGTEPAGGSSYQVTYRYLSEVTPTSLDARTVTLEGGVNGQTALISYSYKLPRHDRICLDQNGLVVYLKGIPAIEQPQPPQVPTHLLSLAVVKNDWFGAPEIENNGTRSISYDRMTRLFDRLVDMIDLVSLTRLRTDISEREPVAKKGVFVDPFTSDRYRDAGEDQNGAVFQGSFQIPIEPAFEEIRLPTISHLNFAQVVIVAQEWVTGCMKVNPYQNFTPPLPQVQLNPAQDFWTETNEQWTSPATQVFGAGNTSRVVSVETITTRETATARFLRQINVGVTIRGFGAGETLASLVFDGINVTPAGVVADADGVINTSFAIPPNVTSGTKLVVAEGGSGRFTRARFVGQGRIETTVRQTVTTIERSQVNPEPPPAPVPSNPMAIVPGSPWWIELPNVAGGGPGDGGGDGADPLAQSFSLPQEQHVTGVDVRFCAIGDRSKAVFCEIVEMDNGFPTTNVIAETVVDMNTVVLNTWHGIDFALPIFLTSGRQYAFVFKTDDADHSLAIASREGYDPVRQRFVAAQPYTVGVLFSSSNAVTWTAHQDDDLAFRIRCARFNPIARTIDLGTFAVTDVSDFIVEANVVLPTSAARLVFEIHPEGETAVRVEPGQVWERQSFFTGNVTLRAILTGSEFVSPLMSRDILLILGTMQADGVYVSRAFDIGTAVRMDAIMKTRLPLGSTLTVEVDAGDDDWQAMPQAAASALADGTFERTYRKDPHTALQGRLRLTLTGTPAARPTVNDLRAFTI